MGYKVIEYFEDGQDNRYPYSAGDTFPREGVKVSDERLAELSSDKNKRGKVLIAEITTTTKKAKAALKQKEQEAPAEADAED